MVLEQKKEESPGVKGSIGGASTHGLQAFMSHGRVISRETEAVLA